MFECTWSDSEKENELELENVRYSVKMFANVSEKKKKKSCLKSSKEVCTDKSNQHVYFIMFEGISVKSVQSENMING